MAWRLRLGGGSANGGPRSARGETTAAILSALPGTATEIAEASGLSRATIYATITRLRKTGVITATGERGNYVYHRAGDPADE